ncbi:hypothetical protein ACX84T_09385 [Burkholderia pseudomallei]|nr:hypothetical protein [Burkholderia pseudomallei]
MRLTCNQLMILLALYRGSRVEDVECGTREHDFMTLYQLGYIDMQDSITPLGDERVRHALKS